MSEDRKNKKHWFLVGLWAPTPGVWQPRSLYVVGKTKTLTIVEQQAAVAQHGFPQGTQIHTVCYLGFETEDKMRGVQPPPPVLHVTLEYQQGAKAAATVLDDDKAVNPYAAIAEDLAGRKQFDDWAAGFNAQREVQDFVAEQSKLF